MNKRKWTKCDSGWQRKCNQRLLCPQRAVSDHHLLVAAVYIHPKADSKLFVYVLNINNCAL